MNPDLYERVRLVTDRFASEGVTSGEIGFIIEVYENGDFEVEFSDTSGITIAQIVVTKQDIACAEERGES